MIHRIRPGIVMMGGGLNRERVAHGDAPNFEIRVVANRWEGEGRGESLSCSLGAFFRISWRDPSAASQVRLCGMTVLGRCDRIQSWTFLVFARHHQDLLRTDLQGMIHNPRSSLRSVPGAASVEPTPVVVTTRGRWWHRDRGGGAPDRRPRPAALQPRPPEALWPPSPDASTIA